MSDLKLVFFEKSPFMSVELLDLLENYKIVCYNNDAVYRSLKKHWDVSTYANTDLGREIENDKAVEIILGDRVFMSEIIKEKEFSYGLFFFMNQHIDQLVRDFGMPMALPTYFIQEKLGNKLHLADICAELKLSTNTTLTFSRYENSSTVFSRCANKLGLPFIVQGALGVSGEDTFLINSEKELGMACNKIGGGYKAVYYLKDNIPVSVHVCILQNNIIIQGPFLQLIGFPELSSNSFQFSGNDTNQSLFNLVFIQKVKDMSLQIATFAKNKGYKGILGIDYLWDKNTDTVYTQELNTRLVGLTRLLTGIQNDQKLIPDILKHLGAFYKLKRSEKISAFTDGNIDNSKCRYSQVIVNNNSSSKVVILKYLEPGIYQLKNGSLKRISNSLFVKNMNKDDILVTYSSYQGKELGVGGLITKIILKDTIVETEAYKLRFHALSIISALKEYTLTL